MKGAIEKAVLFAQIEPLLAWEEPCDRLYFGHEFCQRLLPTSPDLKRAVNYARSKGIGLTLVTPFVTNAGLDLVKSLVADIVLPVPPPGLEIVVNDWGVLNWLHREHPAVPLVLGRLLTKQKRGPQILSVASHLPPSAVDHFRRSNIDVPHVGKFLATLGVRRVELDNLLQGITRDDGMPGSLYHPYGYVTTTRLCLLMGGDAPGKNLRSIGTCRRECRDYDVTLRHPDMPAPLLLKGNTQYFRNDKLPDDLQALNIDRLVFMPALL